MNNILSLWLHSNRWVWPTKKPNERCWKTLFNCVKHTHTFMHNLCGFFLLKLCVWHKYTAIHAFVGSITSLNACHMKILHFRKKRSSIIYVNKKLKAHQQTHRTTNKLALIFVHVRCTWIRFASEWMRGGCFPSFMYTFVHPTYSIWHFQPLTFSIFAQIIALYLVVWFAASAASPFLCASFFLHSFMVQMLFHVFVVILFFHVDNSKTG